MANTTLIQPNPTATSPDTPEISHQQAFDQVMGQFESQPDWLAERRAAAWERFETLPFPQRKDERWRFSSFERDPLADFRIGTGPDAATQADLMDRSNMVVDHAGQLTFADSVLIGKDPISQDLQEAGVFFGTIEDALNEQPELLKAFFLKDHADLGSEKVVALHEALVRSGSFIYVPDNVEVDKPLVVYHWLSQANASVFPHTLIVAGKHARVNVVDVYVSDHLDTPGFAAAVGNIHAGAGSQVFRKVVQNWNESILSFQNDATVADRDAVVKNISVNIGARRARAESQCRIIGPGAEVKMYALTVAEKEQEFDQRTLQIHAAPNAVSDLLFKNALMDTSRTIFSGLILVEENAQQTDAYQTNRNLLLDTTAEANSLPGLEIEANDVKCSHGATTSQLDSEDLFYLRSRGLHERTAKQLMVFGFFEEIIEKVENQELAENLRKLVQSKFSSHSVA